MTNSKLFLAALCTALMLPVAARAGEVRNREIHQEQRIYQGVRSGQLTTHEYDRIQGQEARLNDQRMRDLQRNDGHLTPQEYHQLNREENHLSHTIYRDKHNDSSVGDPH
jgi:hypothetical protein